MTIRDFDTVMPSNTLPALALAMTLGLSACNLSTVEPVQDFEVTNARRLSVGETTTCALGDNGSLYCWGENSTYWQYAVRPEVVPTSSKPFAISDAPLAMLASGHGQHMCGIQVSRQAWCWGRGNNGQIGSGGTATTGNPPTRVAGARFWADIVVSRVTTCGLTTDGDAYCWGLNQRGEGGNASRKLAQFITFPIAVDGGYTFKTIAAGWQHVCALSIEGTAYCWGDNRSGQLGIGSTDTLPRSVAVPVAGGILFQQLNLGANYSCGISTDHQAYCWGDNSTGALGDGTTISRSEPTLVSSSVRFTHIATSSGFGAGGAALPNANPGTVAHTCALAEGGAPHCWGWNGSGQLGDGTTVDRLAPVKVAGNLQLTHLGLGGAHSCGMRDALIWCWGGNVFGQLGAGSYESSSTPLPVLSPFGAP